MSIVFQSTPNLYYTTPGPFHAFVDETPGIPWAATGSPQVRVYQSGGRYGNQVFGYQSSASNVFEYIVPSKPTAHFWLNWSCRRNSNHGSNRYCHGLRVRVGASPFTSISIILGNNGKAQLWIDGGVKTLLGESANAYAIDEWVDLRMRVNVLNGEITAYANDDEFFKGFNAQYPSGNLHAVDMGPTFFPGSGSIIATGAQFWDDIILSYDGPDLGRTALLCLFPNADETAQDWSPASGPDGYAMLDAFLEQPTVSDYVEAATVGDVSKFDVQAPPISVFGLYGVEIQSFQTKTNTSTAETDFVLTVNGTDYNSPAQNLSDASYVLENYIWDQNPDTGAQWQVSDIAGLRMGFEKVT